MEDLSVLSISIRTSMYVNNGLGEISVGRVKVSRGPKRDISRKHVRKRLGGERGSLFHNERQTS